MKKPFESKPLAFYLIASGLFHFFIVLALLFSKQFSFKKDHRLLIENSIRIDQVGLPELKKMKKTVKKPKPKTKAVAVKDKTKKTTPKKEKTPAQKEVKEDKDTEKLSERTDKKENKQIEQQAEKTEIKKGNQLSAGGQGESEKLSSEQYSKINSYAGQVLNQIKNNWDLPKYLADQKLSSEIEIKLNEEGELVYKKMSIPSGNATYDSFVLKAIEQASYPPPPDSIKHIIKKREFVLTVPSQN